MLKGDKEGKILICMDDGECVNIGNPVIMEMEMRQEYRAIQYGGAPYGPDIWRRHFTGQPVDVSLHLTLRLQGAPKFMECCNEEATITDLLKQAQSKIVERDNNK